MSNIRSNFGANPVRCVNYFGTISDPFSDPFYDPNPDLNTVPFRSLPDPFDIPFPDRFINAFWILMHNSQSCNSSLGMIHQTSGSSRRMVHGTGHLLQRSARGIMSTAHTPDRLARFSAIREHLHTALYPHLRNVGAVDSNIIVI